MTPQKLLDASGAAKKLGLEVQWFNLGFPDPFFIVSLPPSIMSHGDVTYIYEGLFVRIWADREDRLTYHVGQLANGCLRHPHSAGGSQYDRADHGFCFGSNRSQIAIFFHNEEWSLFFGFILGVLHNYEGRSAYVPIGTSHILKDDRCRCLSGDESSHVCGTCGYTDILTNATLHFTDAVEIKLGSRNGYTHKDNAKFVQCPNCFSILFNVDDIITTENGDGCSKCVIHDGDKCYVYPDARVILSNGGVAPIAEAHGCTLCKQTRRHDHPCPRLDCPSRAEEDNDDDNS